jgi:hypothetical protein
MIVGCGPHPIANAQQVAAINAVPLVSARPGTL